MLEPATSTSGLQVIGGAHSSSAPLLALTAMASLGSAASLAAAACTLPVAEGQPSCSDGCQPFAHVELVGAHPNVTDYPAHQG